MENSSEPTSKTYAASQVSAASSRSDDRWDARGPYRRARAFSHKANDQRSSTGTNAAIEFTNLPGPKEELILHEAFLQVEGHQLPAISRELRRPFSAKLVCSPWAPQQQAKSHTVIHSGTDPAQKRFSLEIPVYPYQFGMAGMSFCKPADAYDPKTTTGAPVSANAREQMQRSLLCSARPKSREYLSQFTHNSQQVFSPPFTRPAEQPTGFIVYKYYASSTGNQNWERVPAPHPSGRALSLKALEPAGEHITPRKRSTAGSSTCSSHSVPKSSSPLSPLSAQMGSHRPSRSMTLLQGARSRAQPVFQNYIRFRRRTEVNHHSTFASRAVSAAHASDGSTTSKLRGGNIVEGFLTTSASRLTSENLLVRKQVMPAHETISSGSARCLPGSLQDIYYGVLLGASPTLRQVAKDLLTDSVFLRKTTFSEQEARGPQQPRSDGATAENSSEVPDGKSCQEEETLFWGLDSSTSASGQVTSERICVLDGVTLPEVGRRFILANLLFLQDTNAEFSLWSKLRSIHRQLLQISSTILCDKGTCATVYPSHKLPEDGLFGKTVKQEDALFKSCQILYFAQRAHKISSGVDLQPRGRQGGWSARPPHATDGSEKLLRINPVERQQTRSLYSRKLLHPRMLDATASETVRSIFPVALPDSGQSCGDSPHVPSTRPQGVTSFGDEWLHGADELNEDENELDSMEGSSSKSMPSMTTQSSARDAGEGSAVASDVDGGFVSARFRRCSATDLILGCGGKTSRRLSSGKMSRRRDFNKHQFETVIAQLKTAARTSRALTGLRSEVISMRTLSEGLLLSIFQLPDFSSPSTPQTTVLPLIASAYVFILASLLDARKRYCLLLVACCTSLVELLQYQACHEGALLRDAPVWLRLSAELKKQVTLLDTSTLKRTPSFVADAREAFVNVLAIVYPFASLRQAQRLRKRQAKERAQERRLKLRGIEVESLVMKCRNKLADLQLREGRLRLRLAEAVTNKQKAALRADVLEASIEKLRKQELEIQASARTSSVRDPARIFRLQAKVEHLVEQRELQEQQLDTVKNNLQQAYDLVDALQTEKQQSAKARNQLLQERAALHNERRGVQQMSLDLKERPSRRHAQPTGHGTETLSSQMLARPFHLAFRDEGSDIEKISRCIVELTQLVVRALKEHPASAARSQHTGFARDAVFALFSKAYKRYLLRVARENDFRHTLMSCTVPESTDVGVNCNSKSDSEASLYVDDGHLSSLWSSDGSLFEGGEEISSGRNSFSQESGRTELINANTKELKFEKYGGCTKDTCELHPVHSFASSSCAETRGSEATSLYNVSENNSVCYTADKLKPDSTQISKLLQEPLLLARLTAMQVIGSATMAPLSRLSGTAWELMDKLLAFYDEENDLTVGATGEDVHL